MNTYLVTQRRGDSSTPVYRIVSDSALAAKKTACRLDGQDEQNFWQYMAAKEKTRRTAATDRRAAETSKDGSAYMKTSEIIAYKLQKSKRGRRI